MSKVGTKKEGVAPIWMDNAFFEKALRSSEKDSSLKVLSAKVELATAAGDNFFSSMYRATVQLERGNKSEEKSLIVKTESLMESMKEAAKKGVVFEREIRMLRDVIPAMHQFLEEVLPGKFRPLAAKFIYTQKTPDTYVIILEDLAKLGFKMADKSAGLDLKHCLLVMRSVARFHAASIALKKRNPKLMEPFMNNEMLDVFKNEFKDALGFMFTTLAKEMEKWPNYEEQSKKIMDMSPNAALMHANGRTRDDKEFNVLNHGDLWANNSMFRYSEDGRQPVDVRFVDFQISYWTSPTVDLQNFITSSTSNSLLYNPNILLQEYYHTLEETMTLLGCKESLPSWDQLNKQFNTRGEYATAYLLSVRCSVTSERHKFPDQNGVFHYSDVYTKCLETAIPIFEEKGWF